MERQRIGTALCYIGTAGVLLSVLAFFLWFSKILDLKIVFYGFEYPYVLLFSTTLSGITGMIGMTIQGDTEWKPDEGETVYWSERSKRQYERLSNEDKKKYLEWKAKIQAKVDAKEKLRNIKRK